VRFLFVVLLSALAAAWFTSKRDVVVEAAEELARKRAEQTVAARPEATDSGETTASPDGLIIRAARDGHFYLEAQVNGARLWFLVDTGASGVVLSADAARRARISPSRSDYTQRASTANGTVRMAPVSLRELRVGDLRMRDVAGSVNEAEMPLSLLGMSFLNRPDSFEFNGDQLVLRW